MRRIRSSTVGQVMSLVLASGLILFGGWVFSQSSRATQAYTPDNLIMGPALGVPANVIRLHIPANSDGKLDQAVKEEVRDALMAKYGPQLEGAANAGEAEKLLSGSLPEIAKVAEGCLGERKLSYGAKVALKTLYFPDKTYDTLDGKTLRLPAGYYKALQVQLGKGQGKNWWCVMYPPLCYSDLVQRGIIPGAKAASLGRAAVRGAMLVDESATGAVPVEIRLLILDAIRAGLIRIGDVLSYLAEAGESGRPALNLK